MTLSISCVMQKLYYIDSFPKNTIQIVKLYKIYLDLGAQWLSGRVLDSRPKGRGFEPHGCHFVVVLEQDIFIHSLVLVQPRKTQPFITERLLIGLKQSN